MRRAVAVLVVLAVVVFGLAGGLALPALAAAGDEYPVGVYDVGQTVGQGQADSYTGAGGGSETSEITAKVNAKVNTLESLLWGAAAPVIHLLGKISFLVAAVSLVLVLFIGTVVVKRVLTAIACVGLGLALFTNADKIASLLIAFGKWLGQ